MKTFLMIMMLALTNSVLATGWDQLSADEKYEVIEALEYGDALPSGTIRVTVKIDDSFSVYEKFKGGFADYVNLMLETYHDNIDEEAIDQSPYSSYGDPEVLEVILLFDTITQKIVGGTMSIYQDGRDENGEEGDINWSATLLTGDNAELLNDPLYFEWSGH